MKRSTLSTFLNLAWLGFLLSSCSQVLPLIHPGPTPSLTPQPSATLTQVITKTPVPTPTHTIPPSETNTPEPTLSPTITLTDTPTPVKAPAGAHFRGEFEDGILEFDIAEDGKSVRNLKIVIRRATLCQDGKRLGMDYRIYLPYSIPITEYGFPTVFGSLNFRGWFSGARTAAGDFSLTKLEIDGRKPCTLERINWIAAIGG
jgi:hypothetical protein